MQLIWIRQRCNRTESEKWREIFRSLLKSLSKLPKTLRMMKLVAPPKNCDGSFSLCCSWIIRLEWQIRLSSLWRDRRLFAKSLQRSSWQSSILRVFAEESAEFDFFFIFSNRRLQTISTNLTNYSAQKFGNHLPHSESSQRLWVKFFEFSTWEFISKTSLESLLEILFKVLFEIF